MCECTYTGAAVAVPVHFVRYGLVLCASGALSLARTSQVYRYFRTVDALARAASIDLTE